MGRRLLNLKLNKSALVISRAFFVFVPPLCACWWDFFEIYLVKNPRADTVFSAPPHRPALMKSFIQNVQFPELPHRANSPRRLWREVCANLFLKSLGAQILARPHPNFYEMTHFKITATGKPLFVPRGCQKHWNFDRSELASVGHDKKHRCL